MCSGYMHMNSGLFGGQEGADFLELELELVVSHLSWVLAVQFTTCF